MGNELPVGNDGTTVTFENGGSAVLNQQTTTDILTLTNITPGDKVTFDIDVVNDSNVAIIYSLSWMVDGDLAKGLVATADNVTITNGRTAWKAWEGANKQTISVSIELPTTYTVQNESATISFAIEAYQGNAPLILSVDELNQKLAVPENANTDLSLIGIYEPNAVIVVPESYTGTLTLTNCNIAAVQAEKDLDLVVAGAVVANAPDTLANGSAITANGVLNISGNGTLTAIAADIAGGFGIGGLTTTEINISDVTIDKVSGAFVQKDFVNDTKYGKSEPEGGAAIGSGYNGAVINLNNVTINEALGGSKAAGIGARYHTGVEINITNSTIYNVVGGNASAAIGGSRISNGATESGTTINIANSNITAIGGQAGAGIGSGYDTHCQAIQPLCTINIEDSTINATGGKYAAGIGSGYHNAALAGEIKNSTVTAVSGEKFYKDTYTLAQDIGFGVVDPAREGTQAGSYLTLDGEKIYLSFVTVIAEVPTGKVDSYTVLNDTIPAESGKLAVSGGVLDGAGNDLNVTVKGSTDAAISVTGGTIKNLDVVHANHSSLGVGIGLNPYSSEKLTEDLIVDNVSVFASENIFERNIMYAIYAEAANNPNVVITNSALYGAIDVPGADTFTATNTTFGSGEYWFMAISGTSTFTNCTFETTYCLLAYDTAAGKTITFNDCYVGETLLTAENFKSLLVTTAWDYSSDLCSTNLKNCNIVIDGVAVAW